MPEPPQKTTQQASDPPMNGRGGSSNGGAPGEGMDRRIEKKTFTPKRIALAAAALLVVGALAYLVYGAATGGQFRIDLAFRGETPEGLRRGQTIRFRLKLGSPEQAVLLDRGGFYQSTGGNWVYALTGEGEAVSALSNWAG